MSLQATSALFATIVFHAHLRGLTDMVALSLLVTVFSLWFHSTKDRTVVYFDMFFADLYFAYTFVQLLVERSPLLGLLLCVPVTYWFVCNSESTEFWHCVMHAQVIVGSHLYILMKGSSIRTSFHSTCRTPCAYVRG